MNALIKQLSADKTIWRSTLASLFLLCLTLFLSILFYSALPPVLPLFNQLPWGVSRLLPKIMLFLPSILVLLFLIINAVITKYIYEITPVLARMLTITTFLVALLSLVFVFRIVQLIV